MWNRGRRGGKFGVPRGSSSCSESFRAWQANSAKLMILFPPGESSSLSPRICGVSDQLLCSVLPVHAGSTEATGQVRQETAFIL